MTNFFDIATPDEIKEMYDGVMPSAEELALDKSFCEQFPDSNYGKLYLLYIERGDEKTAETYLHLIKDPQYQVDMMNLAGGF